MVTPQDFVNRFFSNKRNQLFLPWLSFNSGPLSVQEFGVQSREMCCNVQAYLSLFGPESKF